MRKLKILDLFCGLGGVARGFQTYMLENDIEFEYIAVDIDHRILRAHKLLNPHSKTVRRDAYSFSDEELRQFDFVWASPPCETHSQLMLYYNKNHEKFKPPDMRLWRLIERMFEIEIPFAVENVRPYYGFIIRPMCRVGRHYLWSNLAIRDIEFDGEKFENVKDDVRKLMEYHEVPPKVKFALRGRKLRDALRDMVHWRLAYRVAEQVIPQLVNGRKIVQERLRV